MAVDYDIINSFKPKKGLNPKVWNLTVGQFDKIKIKQDIRRNLLGSALEFIDLIDIDELEIKDIILVGSMVGYNWSEYSDFDVHILIDTGQFSDEDVYLKLFKSKKHFFDLKYNIKIKGYDVECYVQTTKEENNSKGVYSLYYDKWISEPQEMKITIPEERLKKEISLWSDTIKKTIVMANTGELAESKKKIDELIKKLIKYRRRGLAKKDNEFSVENLTYKYLRRSSLIEKLFNAKINISGKKLSMENLIKEQLQTPPFWVLKLMKYFGIIDGNTEPAENMALIQGIANLIGSGKAVFMNNATKEVNEHTKTVQMILNNLGYKLPNGGIDGKFGPETKKAIMRFQRDMRIPINGIVDTITMKAMLARLKNEDFKSPMATTMSPISMNIDTTVKFLLDKGLSLEQATGIMGNLQAESSFRTHVDGDNKTSYGLAQWHKTRKRALSEFCSARRERIDDINCQLNFLWHELTTQYKGTYNKILNSSTPEESAHYFADEYEIPANKDYSKRKKFARDFFEKYKMTKNTKKTS